MVAFGHGESEISRHERSDGDAAPHFAFSAPFGLVVEKLQLMAHRSMNSLCRYNAFEHVVVAPPAVDESGGDYDGEAILGERGEGFRPGIVDHIQACRDAVARQSCRCKQAVGPGLQVGPDV